MPELTSPSASSSGDASPASTMCASRPLASRTMRPYDRVSSGSKASTVAAAPSRRCVSTRARTRSAVSAGTSPFRTRTSPAKPASTACAERTASPVPSGVSCTATSTPSYASDVSGDATTTTRPTPASSAVRTTQSTIRRPSTGCRCFGVALLMRVPRPPAITTAARSFDMSGENGWGARIRTWDHGTKTRCLTTWPRPTGPGILAAVEEEIDEPDDREDDHGHDHGPLHDPGENHGDHGQQLRGREDPEHLAHDVRAVVAAAEPGEHGHDGEHDHRPLRGRVREEDDDPLGRGDPQREANAARLEPAARPARAVLQRLLRAREHESTVPRWCRDPGAPEALERASRGARGLPVVEEPVDGRTGAADVGTERAGCS